MNIHLRSVRGSVRQVRHHGRRAAAFTLVEMLVTMAVSIILVFALAQAYAVFGEILAVGRANIELAGSLRSVALQLQQDLDRVTVPVRPWTDEGGAQGYFEYIDGPATDKNPRWPTLVDPAEVSRFGDTDDVLAFTAHNASYPFVGVVNGNRRQSPNAEIIWWCQESVDGFGFEIYRRTLLVRPDLGSYNPGPYENRPAEYIRLRNDIIDFSEQNDVSFRVRWWLEDAGGNRIDLRTAAAAIPNDLNNPAHVVQVRFIANSLADLTRRENRYAHPHPFPNWHDGGRKRPPYPFEVSMDMDVIPTLPRPMLHELGQRRPQDLVLTNAFAFDVQAFDPHAPIYASTDGEALVPSDFGYAFAVSPGLEIGRGAFVDLGYGLRDPGLPADAEHWSLLSGRNAQRSWLTRYTYCTWATHYERDDAYQGFHPLGSTIPVDNVQYYGHSNRDRATTGFAYDGQRETSPPYPHPLRGVQVRIRAWDPDYRQVQQATVVSNFVPE